VVYEHHGEAAVAVPKCPTKCIRDFTSGYPQGSTFGPPVCVKDEA
jgi:electron transport complex protein RnfB